MSGAADNIIPLSQASEKPHPSELFSIGQIAEIMQVDRTSILRRSKRESCHMRHRTRCDFRSNPDSGGIPRPESGQKAEKNNATESDKKQELVSTFMETVETNVGTQRNR